MWPSWFVAIAPPSNTYSDENFRKISVEMRLSMMLALRTQTNPVDKMRDFFEDVSLALRADITRGGSAIDTHVLSELPQVPDITDPVYGNEIEVSIIYRYLNTDPATPL